MSAENENITVIVEEIKEDYENQSLEEKALPEVSDVLEVAYEAGKILLENGAEIFRVEETMQHIAGHFGVQMNELYVLSNGILMSDNGENDRSRKKGLLGHEQKKFAKIQHIPVGSARLDKIVAVNQLSREVCEGKYTLPEVAKRLEEIRTMTGKKKITMILASGIGAGAFSVLFGGNWRDMLVAVVAGLILCSLLLLGMSKMSRIMSNLVGAAVVSVICLVFYKLGIGEHLNFMIIGSVMPLIPGVPFVNGIRDIADGDYLSGAIRLLDALLVFGSIAIGVGAVFLIYRAAFGGSII